MVPYGFLDSGVTMTGISPSEIIILVLGDLANDKKASIDLNCNTWAFS